MSEALPTIASKGLTAIDTSVCTKIVTLHPCPLCGKIFNQSCNRTRHVREVHKVMPDKTQHKFQCDAYGCECSYTTKGQLQTHQKKKHPEEAAAEQEKLKLRSKIICPESECVEHCLSRDDLRKHIVDTHDLHIQQTDLTFPTREEFKQWKADIEKAECTYYRKPCAKVAVSRDPKNKKYVEHFWCHRSGEFISEAKDVNNPKKTCRETIKMGRTCPAAMKVFTSSDSPMLTVTFWTPHIGHGPDPPIQKNLPKPPKPERKNKKLKSSEIDGSPIVKNKKTANPSLQKAVKRSRLSKVKCKGKLSELDNSMACIDNETEHYEELCCSELELNEETVTTHCDPILNEATGEFEHVVDVPENCDNQEQRTLDGLITVTSNQKLVFILDTKSVLQRSTNSVQNVGNVPLTKSSDLHKFGAKKMKMLNRVEALHELVKSKNELADADYSRVMNKINECFTNITNSH